VCYRTNVSTNEARWLTSLWVLRPTELPSLREGAHLAAVKTGFGVRAEKSSQLPLRLRDPGGWLAYSTSRLQEKIGAWRRKSK
jgi:hypothetical protein